MALSPMMQQYLEIHEQYKDCILFFRLGDFYEMFFDDAKLVSRLLELTLTGKRCGLEERAPMCGVPFHAADSYTAKLVEMGYKVAICEQLEDPAKTKGMVKRGVIRVVTPGTVTSSQILKEDENNYLACAYLDGQGMAVAYCDISTGELAVTEQRGKYGTYEDLLNELVRISPREILANKDLLENHDSKEAEHLTGAFVSPYPEELSLEAAEETVRAQFGNGSLTALGLAGRDHCILAVGTLLSYLLETQKQGLSQLTDCRYYEIGGRMSLDKATIRNLEITETLYDKRTAGSLLGILNKTGTAMGARMLKHWLREPLNDTERINARLDAVQEILENPGILSDIRESLKQVYDFERLSGRIASGNANGKDMIALKNSIGALPQIRAALDGTQSSLLNELKDSIVDLEEIHDKIERAITEDPPATVKEGGLIRTGYSEQLDAMKDSIKDAKAWIAGLEAREKERTGITHLKVGFNKVFGYYIEVSRSNLDQVPEDYIRKQTLVGAERFIIPELKEQEGIVLNAEGRINDLEYDLFTELRHEIEGWIREIQRSSQAIAQLDVLSDFANVSLRYGYTRPEVDDSDALDITGGRHPVIEQTTEMGMFVSNDTQMNETDASMMIITGPNMSGKSTYMRQTALIVLMAQIGCFVPADRAHIGTVDRIFTRIGASDNLAQGQSTFFVEMSELAYILRHATPRSLIILDEIGRGTSTYDGLSIAWAVVEYLCSDTLKIRTMFATHYHELTVLEDQIPGVKNYNIDVLEDSGQIVFLHKIVPGSASRSYGIHVARLAGVPDPLLKDAEEKLAQLEGGEQEAEAQILTSSSDSATAPNSAIDSMDPQDSASIAAKSTPSNLEPDPLATGTAAANAALSADTGADSAAADELREPETAYAKSEDAPIPAETAGAAKSTPLEAAPAASAASDAEKLRKSDRGGENGANDSGTASGSAGSAAQASGVQLSLFAGPLNPALERIRSLYLMEITPSQAIHELEILQELANKE